MTARTSEDELREVPLWKANKGDVGRPAFGKSVWRKQTA
jgi:hypothetical protein